MAPQPPPPQASTSTAPAPMAPMDASGSGTDRSPSTKRPKVLLMGPRGGGKSSIRKVVFEGLAPSDTLFLEKTARASSTDVNSFVSLDIFDLPGGALSPESWNINFAELGAVIFVLDGQSSFQDIIRKLAITMGRAYDANPGIQFEIFMHKIDGMSEDFRLDTLLTLRDRLTEDLFDLSPELESNMNVFYHLTSVFDTSIYEALSKIVAKLMPEQAALERLLDLLVQHCSLEKAFLFDTSSKLYICTDSSPLDSPTYVICSEYIDLISDFTLLYEPDAPMTGTAVSQRRSSSTSRQPPKGGVAAITPATAAPPRSPSVALSTASTAVQTPYEARTPSSKVRLSNNSYIAQWSISPDLSLVALVRPNVLDQRASLIEYNVSTFRDAIGAIFRVRAPKSPGA